MLKLIIFSNFCNVCGFVVSSWVFLVVGLLCQLWCLFLQFFGKRKTSSIVLMKMKWFCEGLPYQKLWGEHFWAPRGDWKWTCFLLVFLDQILSSTVVDGFRFWFRTLETCLKMVSPPNPTKHLPAGLKTDMRSVTTSRPLSINKNLHGAVSWRLHSSYPKSNHNHCRKPQAQLTATSTDTFTAMRYKPQGCPHKPQTLSQPESWPTNNHGQN